MSLVKNLQESVEYVQACTPIKPRVGVILGSGFSNFSDIVDIKATCLYKDIPHFLAPKVESHVGELVLGHIGSTPVAVLRGRIHYYEGHSMQEIVYPTRMLARLGIEKLILTNAAGGLKPEMSPGEFMVLTDHINLLGGNPLIGPNEDSLGLRFPDVSNLYDPDMREALCQLLDANKVAYHRGVYCAMTGPSFETAAEVQFLYRIGGGSVGMSTVPEALAACHMGVKVCALSCITNMAAGVKPGTISHEEVFKIGAQACKKLQPVLGKFIEAL